MRGKTKHRIMYEVVLWHANDIISGRKTIEFYKKGFLNKYGEVACDYAKKDCVDCPIGDCMPFYNRMWKAIDERDKKTFKKIVREIRDAWGL